MYMCIGDIRSAIKKRNREKVRDREREPSDSKRISNKDYKQKIPSLDSTLTFVRY